MAALIEGWLPGQVLPVRAIRVIGYYLSDSRKDLYSFALTSRSTMYWLSELLDRSDVLTCKLYDYVNPIHLAIRRQKGDDLKRHLASLQENAVTSEDAKMLMTLCIDNDAPECLAELVGWLSKLGLDYFARLRARLWFHAKQKAIESIFIGCLSILVPEDFSLSDFYIDLLKKARHPRAAEQILGQLKLPDIPPELIVDAVNENASNPMSHPDVIRTLFRLSRVHVDQTDSRGISALCMAVRSLHIDAMETLLELGASPLGKRSHSSGVTQNKPLEELVCTELPARALLHDPRGESDQTPGQPRFPALADSETPGCYRVVMQEWRSDLDFISAEMLSAIHLLEKFSAKHVPMSIFELMCTSSALVFIEKLSHMLIAAVHWHLPADTQGEVLKVPLYHAGGINVCRGVTWKDGISGEALARILEGHGLELNENLLQIWSILCTPHIINMVRSPEHICNWSQKLALYQLISQVPRR